MNTTSLLLPALFVSAFAFADDPVTLTPKPVVVRAPIAAVTLYQGRAAVTREATAAIDAGVWELRFDDLPPSVIAASLQASVPAPAKLLDVRYEEVVLPAESTANPEMVALDKELQVLRRQLAQFGANRETFAATMKLLDAISSRIASNAGENVGKSELDPAKLKLQVEYLEGQRTATITKALALDEEIKAMGDRIAALESKRRAIGGGGKVERTGIVTVANGGDAATITVGLTYQTDQATWVPSYALRADSELTGLSVEFDAIIQQRTGEPWENVRLTLSTATPARSAEPPALGPIYVSVLDQRPTRGVVSAPAEKAFAGGELSSGLADAAPASSEMERHDAQRAGAEASVVRNATAASFVLPRTVSLPTDSQREQKTRVASIALTPQYVYVTRPAVDPGVYLRGRASNDSPYQLLQGKANVFLGGDSIGQVILPDIAPGGEIELWFGSDKRIAAERVLVSKKASTAGLISKSSDLAFQYRIDLTNTIDRPVQVEVWDRIPVSRDERITIGLSDVQPPIVRDAEYEADERKQGLLKWFVTLPAASPGRSPDPFPIRWAVKVSRPADVGITPLPE